MLRAATSPTVTVANISPTQSLTSLAPASVTAGSPGFALTVAGSGFVRGATATIGGQARTLTVGSATQLIIAVLAGDVSSQGNVAVQITNPAACVGGICVSNTIALPVTAPPPAPTLSTLAPSTVASGGGAFIITATGTNFVPTSVVLINCAPRTTTFVSASQLTATILASDIASAGNPSLTVLTPAPGGGASNAAALTVSGPSLAVSTTVAAPGATLTATLSNAPGTASSWVALAAVGAPNPSYVNWTFIDALPGTSTKTWTVALPATAGQYEIRLFQGLTYNRTATSPVITVGSSGPPSTIALSTTQATPGASLTATLSNPPGTANDWIALAAVGAPDSSHVQWIFAATLPGTTTKTWTVPLPATPGQYEVRFFQGLTYNRVATSPVINVGN